MEDGYDSEASPEELTFEQGIKQDEEILEVQKENKARVAREKKDRQRQWAQRNTAPKRKSNSIPTEAQEVIQDDMDEHAVNIPGMLPKDVLSFLEAREKHVFSSDSEEEMVDHEAAATKKRKRKSTQNTVLLKDLPPPPCAQNSLDFLKKRKLEVPRSHAVLKNADRALRFLSSRGGCLSKS